ncbi:MAG: CHAT domain-containing protein [Melioribacteraceae bacterium]|nr:CHAT domain-containing protein [Melioribacteraceae bacterium]
MNKQILPFGFLLFVCASIAAQDTLKTRASLAPLPFARIEVQYISDLLSGELLLGKEATKKNILNSIEKYDIIHIAAHTEINELNPLSSKFHLYNNPNLDEEDESLFLSRIYSLQLNAKMAVLSSCNTGTGKLQKGEGIISFARAFKFAGCPSVIMSLWAIDDISTATIMKDFYSELKENKPKDVALREAKLAYLKKSNSKTAAPVFWAGTVPIGNLDKLEFGSPLNGVLKLVYSFIFLLLLTSMMFYFIKRKKKII